MPAKKQHTAKPITEIGQTVPGNFKFGLIVAVALFWADFLRSLLNGLFSLFKINAPIVTNLIMAIVVTVLAILVLLGYRKIKSRLEKVKV